MKFLTASALIFLTFGIARGKEVIRLKIVYDNVALGKGLISAWGFSCLIEKKRRENTL